MLQTGGKIDKTALVIDIRGEFFNELLSSLDDLENEGIRMEILFWKLPTRPWLKVQGRRRRHPGTGGQGS